MAKKNSLLKPFKVHPLLAVGVVVAAVGLGYFVRSIFAATYNYSIIHPVAGSGVCLDVPGGNYANGVQVELWQCNGGSNQKWYWQAWSGSGGYYYLHPNGARSKCVDLPHGVTTNNTKLILYDCNGSANQIWFENGTPSNMSLLSDVNVTKCIDDPGGVLVNGTKPVIYSCNSSRNQHWNSVRY